MAKTLSPFFVSGLSVIRNLEFTYVILAKAGPISLTVIAVSGCTVSSLVAFPISLSKYPALTGLTTPTASMVSTVRMGAHSGPMATIRPVHKSPSLTIVKNRLAAMVSTVALTVSRTISFS